ncbi:uncharacterized protein LOC121745889 [Salvia splendens]|uniref:uncharacterized protein LOC121745889 n=1 Tax=Salvia splendens TaxID=180675 RepID=UPI001C27052B|nr:uncharacterized protein LOC121745889 [Salvia splendens]
MDVPWEHGDTTRRLASSSRGGSRGGSRGRWLYPTSNHGRSGDEWMGNVMSTNKYYSLMANGEFDVEGCGEMDAVEMDIQTVGTQPKDTPLQIDAGTHTREDDHQILLTNPDPDRYSKALGLKFKGSNMSGKIWVFAEEGANFIIEEDLDQVLHGRLTSHRMANYISISVVYAKCNRLERHPLWDKMREISTRMEGTPWLIGGDFNTILAHEDRVGSETNRQAEMIDFVEVIEDCRLLDPGLLVNEAWTNAFEATRVTNLPRVSSDHGPILARCTMPRPPSRGSAFRFQNMWVRHDGFLQLVQDIWAQPTGASGLLNLQTKLARSKKALKAWNKEVFGNIHANLQAMEEGIAQAQANFEADPTPRNRTEINKNIAEYILLLRMEENFWRQKTALRWLADGDKNTRFYQSWVKQKRVRLRIHSINVDELEELHYPPDPEEVKKSVFDISGDSARGPDGFSAVFYQTCWGIIGTDVVEAIKQVFLGAYLPRSVTATNIVLFPKKASPETWADFRPISLCNVLNKVITKVLTASLAPFLPQVISPNQSGFMNGRLLHDNVLLAQEMFHELARRSPAPNVAIKIDMAKAYDRVQWSFLIKVLRRMGFPAAWVDLIERCIGFCWFSILINGAPAGFFKSTRGLRQGDPISPALFVIAADYLSRALDKLILGKKEMTFKASRRCMEISHLAYADDIIIFTQAAANPLRRIRG